MPSDGTRVAVLGAGAMGSLYGGALTEAGVDATLVDIDRDLVDHLNAEGVRIVEREGERALAVRATSDPADLAPVDVVLVFVKAYATASAARLIAPHTREDTLVLSLQNGWGCGAALAEVFAADRVLLGVSYQSATALGRGVVARTAAGATELGSPVGNDEAAARLAALLRSAGFETVIAADVERLLWEKLVVNAAANPTAALTGLRASELTRTPQMRALIDGLAHEAVAVANAIGHPIDAETAVEHVQQVLHGAGEGKGSMLQDVEARRRTEIDVITGAIVRAADRAGIDVPLNRTIYSLVLGYEQALAARSTAC